MGKPYYEYGGITIYHGDCLDVLPALAHGNMILVSDPPYAMVNTFGVSNLYGRRAMQFDMDKTGDAIDCVLAALNVSFGMVSAYHLFCDLEHYGAIAGIARHKGLTPKPWARVKKCPPPPMPGNWWPSAFEAAQYGYRSGAWFGDDGAKRSNVYVADAYRHGIHASEKVGHPTQKWLPMIEYIVGCIVPPDGVALDPFSGSGTTLRAAKNLGRKAIGIEIEERYCEMAANRLAQEVMALA